MSGNEAGIENLQIENQQSWQVEWVLKYSKEGAEGLAKMAGYL